jgi:hypothetical protein
LEFEAEHFPLTFGYSENTCNSLAQPSATLEIAGEALLIMPPQLPEQRAFMRLSEVERLALLLREMNGGER